MIKTTLFMKLTLVIAKQSTSVNLNSILNCVQINTRDMPGIAIVERIKLQNTVGKQITTLAGIRRILLMRKAG